MITASNIAAMRRLVREFGRTLLDCVARETCAACGDEGPGLCAVCARLLERRRPPWCDRCGTPIAPAGDGRCRVDHRILRNIAFARAPFGYAGTAGALVRRLKFQHDRGAAERIVGAMAESLLDWSRAAGRRSVVVAVPMYRRKLRRRGLDHAGLLAALLATRLGLEFLPGGLRRIRETLPQGDPRVTSRDRNVERAFEVARESPIRGRAVLLVDDVLTSGATARECARVLRRAGAANVVLATACNARG